MSSCLAVVGSTSHVLRSFIPARSYDCIIQCDRRRTPLIYKTDEFLEYDLCNQTCNSRLLARLKEFRDVSVLYSSFVSADMHDSTGLEEVSKAVLYNCLRPLELFSRLSEELEGVQLNGVFISSIYARVSPKSSNYVGMTPKNPLFYGVCKAGVEQGLRWLSTKNSLHRFNAIGLGPMPNQKVISDDPGLIGKLVENMPSGELVGSAELNDTINFLLQPALSSLRGATIPLDGGYSIW